MLATTIVIPCFNEAARLDLDALREAIAADGSLEFVMVDDGSTDRTAALLDTLQSESPERFHTLILDRNRGKAEAVRRGILAALEHDPQVVGYWDADLATPLGEIDRLRKRLEEGSQRWIVMGSRVRRLGARVERSAMRHYAGRVFATFASLALKLPVYDTQCGAKLLRVTPAVRRCFDEPFASRWIFDVELLARLLREARLESDRDPRGRFYEQPLSSWRDVAGSKLKAGHTVQAGLELLGIARSYADVRRGRSW
jgi:dolichyl-phosphate beta-glucosyltransferase